MNESVPPEPRTAAAMRRRRLLGVGVRLIGPALVLVLLLQLHHLDAVLAALTWDDAGLLTAGGVLGVLAHPLRALRWRTLLVARGHRYALSRSLLSLLSTGYVGHLTPGRVGDVLRLQYLRHDLGMPYPDGLALLMIDRCCDVYVPLTVAVVAACALAPMLTGDLVLVTWLGVLFMAAGPPLLFVPATARGAAALALRVAPGWAAGEGLDRFFAGLRHQRPRHLAVAAVFTALALLLYYAQAYTVALALDLQLSFVNVIFLLAIAGVLGAVPITIAGLGVRELFFALAFPQLGSSAEAGVIFGLGVFLVVHVPATVLGFVSWQIAPPPLGTENQKVSR
ncbi:lysylphosphatidylglycerol synthase transmembrane domain-containing protein [Nannocystis sp.]|uniref:lysylphosphatidylglycerol synthase transmembrane domain-containing protein n=1 Tax=Nannocystis sp. TaxID=1962667 RepID=UPI0025D7E240|nr:lysylphosphatidylglycerol synthase transmembrane domain-containing protein [Nannocystis sp.]MBK7826956.1 flippase-like domain-containing protein [Nannocystis sp.]